MMGTEKYGFPKINGSSSAKVPRDFNALADSVDVALDREVKQLREITNTLSSASPKGIYATLAALQSDKPAGAEGVYLVTADGKWYYHDGSSWVAGGTYQATGISDLAITESKLSEQSVTPEKTNFFTTGKNKFNAASSEVDRLLQSNGQTIVTAGYKTSGFIYLPSGTYTLSNVRWYGFYDLNRGVLSNPFVNTGSNNAIVTVTTSQPCYLRVSYVLVNEGIVQVEAGSTATSYESYKINASKLRLMPEQIQQILPVTDTKLALQAVTPERTNFVVPGKNKLNLDNAETDRALQSNGQTTTSAGYKTSSYIYLPTGTYTLSRIRWYGFYDLSKTNVLSTFVNTGNNAAVTTITTTQDCFLRVSYLASLETTVQIESGTVSTDVEPFNFQIPRLRLTPEQVDQASGMNRPVFDVKLTKIGETFTFESQFDSSQNIVIQTSRNGSKNGAFNFLSTSVGGVVIHPNTDDITPIRTFATVGANHGYTTVVIVTMSGHGKTTADLGSLWTDGMTQYTLLNINGNDLTFGCPYTVTMDVVSSTYVAPVANLSHVSGATNTGNVTTTTLASEPQLFPSINNISVKYVLDGKEIVTDGEYYGNELQIRENYTVMDYKSILDYAQVNIGSSYKTANIAGVVRLSNVFTYRNGLKCTTAHGFETLKKVSLLNCGFLQAIPLSVPGHTRKRFMPGVKAKSGWDFEAGIDLDAYNTSLIFGPSDLKTAGVAPSHYTDWTYLNGVRKYGFTMGYIVDRGNAKHAERIANTTTIWDMRNTKKSYPITLRGTLEAGEYRSFLGFRNYVSPEEVGEATNLNVVDNQGATYVYATLNINAVNMSKTLNGKIGKTVSVLQSSNLVSKSDVVDANGIILSTTAPISDAILKLT